MFSSLTKKQKCGILIFSSLFVLMFFFSLEDEKGLESKTAAEVPAVSQVKAEPRVVQDEQTAVSLDEIRNPFSFGHERRGEVTEIQTGQQPARKENTGNGHAVRTAQPVHKEGTPRKFSADSSQPVVELRGVFYGETNAFVILSAGARSASLAEGESFCGWQVQKIEHQGVWLAGPGGKRYLQLDQKDADKAAGKDGVA